MGFLTRLLPTLVLIASTSVYSSPQILFFIDRQLFVLLFPRGPSHSDPSKHSSGCTGHPAGTGHCPGEGSRAESSTHFRAGNFPRPFLSTRGGTFCGQKENKQKAHALGFRAAERVQFPAFLTPQGVLPRGAPGETETSSQAGTFLKFRHKLPGGGRGRASQGAGRGRAPRGRRHRRRAPSSSFPCQRTAAFPQVRLREAPKG